MRHAFLTFPKNVYVLFFCQIIGAVGTIIITLFGGLIGAKIAPSPTLATLPATTMIVGVAVSTIPAALLMKKIGRKNGFLLSAIMASCAALFTAFAVSQGRFALFCLGTFFIGSFGAFVQQFRFAAIESVAKNTAGKAIGFILLAGILAGFLGPEIAKRTKDILSLPEYTGPFVVMALLYVVAVILLTFLRNVKIADEEEHAPERALKSIVSQPNFFIAALAGASGYGIMTFIMTATPIHLHDMAHYSIDMTVFVIQSHIIAMFLPSLFTGSLIQKFGVFKMLLAGIACFCITVVLGVFAQAVFPYWMALVLLGIGWNFLYISSTVLLAQSYSHSERFKAQGVNDFIVVTSQMIASFMAGSILFTRGWINLNLLALPIIAVALFFFVLNRKRLLQV